jgi:hypothetical protein
MKRSCWQNALRHYSHCSRSCQGHGTIPKLIPGRRPSCSVHRARALIICERSHKLLPRRKSERNLPGGPNRAASRAKGERKSRECVRPADHQIHALNAWTAARSRIPTNCSMTSRRQTEGSHRTRRTGGIRKLRVIYQQGTGPQLAARPTKTRGGYPSLRPHRWSVWLSRPRFPHGSRRVSYQGCGIPFPPLRLGTTSLRPLLGSKSASNEGRRDWRGEGCHLDTAMDDCLRHLQDLTSFRRDGPGPVSLRDAPAGPSLAGAIDAHPAR